MLDEDPATQKWHNGKHCYHQLHRGGGYHVQLNDGAIQTRFCHPLLPHTNGPGDYIAGSSHSAQETAAWQGNYITESKNKKYTEHK